MKWSLTEFNKTTLPWVESNLACRQLGGQIINQGRGWSNIKAWRYTSGIRYCQHGNIEVDLCKTLAIHWQRQFVTDGGLPEFSNWADGHPNFSLGLCTSVDETGNLRSTNCSDSLFTVCNSTMLSGFPQTAYETKTSTFKTSIILC